MLKRAPSYRTLELELLEWQERELFEYFVVVSLKKKPSRNTYLPEVSYQFPKVRLSPPLHPSSTASGCLAHPGKKRGPILPFRLTWLPCAQLLIARREDRVPRAVGVYAEGEGGESRVLRLKSHCLQGLTSVLTKGPWLLHPPPPAHFIEI